MNNLINTMLITNYIKEHNLTIKEFCNNCNISQNIYSKIMNNNNNFDANKLFNIAKALQIQAYKLFIK